VRQRTDDRPESSYCPLGDDYTVEVKMQRQCSANPQDAIEPIEFRHRTTRTVSVRRFLGQCLLAALVGLACTLPVAASPLLPALVEPASQEHHPGKVIFVELVTPDIAAAKKFYAGLFGWTFRDVESGRIKYAEASLDGRPVAGLIHKEVPTGEQRQPAWLNFIAVRDVDAARTVALAQGGKVLFGPHSIPNRGRQAVFADPQGAIFAVLASSSGDPPDLLALPGEWIWSSLITTDPDTDAAFYQTLFDYEVFDLPDDGGSQHLLFASDNYARASANPLPDNRPNVHPHWLNYVHVEDAGAIAAKVLALGGRVLVEPRVDRHGGRVAVVADPQGARFGLLEWPDNETKEVPQ
jgi:predicted enzyme related to lactoylglutathione lyase